jgi:DNA-binding response OmpR family regulator
MEKSMGKRILVIEDDDHIAEGIKLNLELQGYDVSVASDGVSGLAKWKTYKPSLIVLDIMLPGIDGLTILQNIRLEDERIPILILSAKSGLDDKVKGLSYGVDDYLSKPFHLEEFLLRTERLLKRGAWSRENGLHSTPQTYKFGDNVVDFDRCIAECKKGVIRLTEQEVKLLKLFVSNRGKPLSRDRLLEIGWGYTKQTTTRTVDNFIVRFRKYFEDNPKNPVYFKSLRSVGYMFDHD